MSNDTEYFQKRAEDELARAQASDHPGVVRAHYMMAGFYLDRAHNGLPQDPSGDTATAGRDCPQARPASGE